MSENKENKKNKNLNEKEIEKVSGGKQAGGCLAPTFRPQLLAYGGPKLTPAIAYGGPRKKKTSSSNEVKNLQPSPDEDKDKN